MNLAALDRIPVPGPDCTEWRTICDGHYRWYANRTGVQYAYPDGRVLTCPDLDWD